MADNGALTTRQARFCAALLEAASIRAAAKVARIGERTAWRLLAEPAVRQHLAERTDGLLTQAAAGLASDMAAARETLRTVMDDARSAPAVRVLAARVILDAGLRLAELVALAERVNQLEGMVGGDGTQNTTR